MKLESIKLKNFKAFKDVEMNNIPNFCILVGANGVGKSTLFNVFGFLKEALNTNVNIALTRYGGNKGFDDVRSRDADGPIEIELKFRTENIEKKPLITYSLSINKKDKKAYVEREILKYRRGSKGSPWIFLDFSDGRGKAVINEYEKVKDMSDLKREEQTLKSNDILAIKGLAQFEKFPAVMALGDLIENWHISDFHISSAKKEQDFGYHDHLSTDGDNLSLVVQYLYDNHKDIFNKILNSMKERIPGISHIEAKTTEEGKVLLKFQDGAFEESFLARYVSDGTIKMLAYLVLLYDPKPHSLLCVEEPENQLYYSLLEELAEEFRAYSLKNQVFVSTHSPEFLNAADLDEVFFLIKDKGYTKIERAADNQQLKEYMDAGDKMGYLWREGLFRGVNPA